MSNYKNEIRENVIRTYKALVDETYAPKVVEPVITVENMAAIADAAEQGGGGGASVQEFDGEYKLNVSALLEKLGDNKNLPANNAKILLGTTYTAEGHTLKGATDYIDFIIPSDPTGYIVDLHFNDQSITFETSVTDTSANIATILAGIDSEEAADLSGNIVPIFAFTTSDVTVEVEYSSYNVEDLFTLVEDTTSEETPTPPAPVPPAPVPGL